MSSRLFRAVLISSLTMAALANVSPLGAAPAPTKTDEAEKLFLEAIDAYEGPKQLDEIKARKLFEKAAARGHDLAAGCAGWMVYKGEGGPMDRPGGLKMIEKVLPAIRKKAEAGDARAQELLGALLSEGIGVTQNEREAFEWFSKAAAKGYASAMTWLGVAYALGTGVKEDHKKALEWLEKAAMEANPGAMTWLGFLYVTGQGVEADDKKAVEWYRKGADRGRVEAMNNLGLAYADGRTISEGRG